MRMYYFSFDRSRRRFVIGLATSRDGFKWDKQGPIFEVRAGLLRSGPTGCFMLAQI
jgi:hypothetical protein